MAADAKDGNTFYFTRYSGDNVDLWKSTNGGAAWAKAGSVAQAPWPWGSKTMLHTFKNTVADNGEVWVSAFNGLHRSTTGATSFTSLAKVTRCLGFAFGKAATGSSYPTLFVAGKVKVDGTNEKEGVFLSTNLGETFTQITAEGKPLVGGMGGLNDMVGDQRTFGRVYITLPGHGIIYSTANGTPTGGPGTGSNLALNRTATTSSVEGGDSTNRGGALAFDGNSATRWASAQSDPQWIYVDLGTSYSINRVVLDWETAAARDYKLQVGDNPNGTWTDLLSVTNNMSSGIKDHAGLSGTGRYVRMYGTARVTQWGYSLREMEVYGTASTSAAVLPSPWVGMDIGAAPSQAGSSSYDSGTSTWTIDGGGDDIWGTSDKFRYVYQDGSSDQEIQARVTSVENTNPWAKAGVMIRESTAAGSAFAMILQRPDNQVIYQARTSTGGSVVLIGELSGGTGSVKYVRIVRSGNSFTGYYKVNSWDSWTQLGTSQTIVMGSATKIGLAVTAHTSVGDTAANLVATATFSNVTATP
jgi:hypothetical protein